MRNHPSPHCTSFTKLNVCARAKGFTIETSSNYNLASSLNSAVDYKDPEVNKVSNYNNTLVHSFYIRYYVC